MRCMRPSPFFIHTFDEGLTYRLVNLTTGARWQQEHFRHNREI